MIKLFRNKFQRLTQDHAHKSLKYHRIRNTDTLAHDFHRTVSNFGCFLIVFFFLSLPSPSSSSPFVYFGSHIDTNIKLHSPAKDSFWSSHKQRFQQTNSVSTAAIAFYIRQAKYVIDVVRTRCDHIVTMYQSSSSQTMYLIKINTSNNLTSASSLEDRGHWKRVARYEASHACLCLNICMYFWEFIPRENLKKKFRNNKSKHLTRWLWLCRQRQ